jgi:hypothetical protein
MQSLSAPYLKNRQQVPHLKVLILYTTCTANSLIHTLDACEITYICNHDVPSFGQVSRDGGEAAAAKGDLTGRGLCLVPISSTFAVASETPVDFWSPFGAAFR